MRKFITSICLLASASVFAATAEAPGVYDNDTAAFAVKPAPKYNLSVNGGGVLAFGDDSYDIFKDFNNANGYQVAVSFGRDFTDVWGARLKVRYLHMFSRVNLESLESNGVSYWDDFRRNGFYGYNCFGVQAEGTMNATNLIWPKRQSRWFNVFLNAGVGVSHTFNYDKHVKNWSANSGVIGSGYYEVDTKPHTMPSGIIGGAIDFRLCRELSLNFEMQCNFTGDKLEGVKYEEGYDAYVTYSVGVTTYF